MLLELGCRERQPAAGDHGSLLDRVPAGIGQRQELMAAGEVREVEPRHPLDRVQGQRERVPQPPCERRELGRRRCPVEAADPDVHRVDRPAAQQRHDRVPGAAQRQAALDDVPVICCHLDGARVPEEVGRVQHVDVQRVTADPFPAIQQPAQVRDRAVDTCPARVLDRLAGAGLVGDGADATDPRRDIRWLGVGAAAQERLEEARRLVDVEPHLVHPAAAHPDVHGAFALDPGKPGGYQRALAPVRHRTGVPA
jgi:hypothetical protein